MSELSEHASYLISKFLDEMADFAAPPHKFHHAWCFVSDDEEDRPEHPPSGPYILSELTKWARESQARSNRFRLYSYQLKKLVGCVYPPDEYDDNTFDYDADSQALNDLKIFFAGDPHWEFTGQALKFHAKIPIKKKLQA
jgi:hypothetical protein